MQKNEKEKKNENSKTVSKIDQLYFVIFSVTWTWKQKVQNKTEQSEWAGKREQEKEE